MVTLAPQSCMAKEGERECRVAPDAGEARGQGPAQRRDVGRAHVGQFPPLDVAPPLFDGVQLGGIAGQAFDGQPVALAAHVGGHRTALVSAQPVPDQNDARAANVPLQLAQKCDERPGRVGAGARLKVKAGTPAIPAKGERPGHREPLPMATGMDQDGGLAAGRPRAADDGLLRDPAFVFEDEPRSLTPRVFFTAGQRRVTHCRLAGSSRSRAWRAGRCGDQFRRRRRYQT